MSTPITWGDMVLYSVLSTAFGTCLAIVISLVLLCRSRRQGRAPRRSA